MCYHLWFPKRMQCVLPFTTGHCNTHNLLPPFPYSLFSGFRTRPVSKAASTDKGRREPWHTFLNEAFEVEGHLGTKWLPCDSCAVGLTHNIAGGWRKASDPHATQLTPSTQHKNGGIMQTGQAGAISGRLDGFNCGDAQDEAMDAAAWLALRFFRILFWNFLFSTTFLTSFWANQI